MLNNLLGNWFLKIVHAWQCEKWSIFFNVIFFMQFFLQKYLWNKFKVNHGTLFAEIYICVEVFKTNVGVWKKKNWITNRINSDNEAVLPISFL